MRNSVELMDEKTILKKQASDLIANAKAEIRMLTAEENETIENIKKQIMNINEEMRQLDVELPLDEKQNLEKLNNTKMEKSFSLLTAIRNVANNRAQDELTSAVIEAGAEEMRKAGMNYVGQIQLPSAEYRTVTVATEGVDTVATNLMDVLEPLRSRNVLINAGAKYITGLVGDVQYPVMDAINATWEGEIADASVQTPTFSHVKLQPKRLSVVVPISKQFLIQDGCGAEQAIRNEIINAVNGKLEATILGSANATATQPAGLFYNNGAALDTISDFAGICDLEAGLETANFYGDMKYIMSPSAKAAMRGMAKTGTANGLVFENGEVDGTGVLTTSHVAGKNLVYGDFSNLVIANWGNLDLTVDTVTLAAQGCIRLVINAYFDAKVLRDGAFAVAKMA